MINVTIEDGLPQRLKRYLADGWSLLAVAPGAKAPEVSLCKHGVHSATRNLDTIKEWFESNPNLNWGVAVGKASNGLLVLDFDDPSLYERVQARGVLPTTRSQETGRGHHLFYHLGFELPKGRKFPKVDVICNGYVLVEPSVHPNGHLYKMSDARVEELTWDNVAVIYEALGAECCQRPGRSSHSMPAQKGRRERPQADDWLKGRNVLGLMRDGLSVGERWKGFSHCIAQFAAVGFTEDRARECLKCIHEATEQAPGNEFPWEEVEKMLARDFAKFKKELLRDATYTLSHSNRAWARTHWNPAKVRASRGNVPTFHDRVTECLERLEQANVPPEWSVRRAGQALRECGLGMRNKVVAAAVTKRKELVSNGGLVTLTLFCAQVSQLNTRRSHMPTLTAGEVRTAKVHTAAPVKRIWTALREHTRLHPGQCTVHPGQCTVHPWQFTYRSCTWIVTRRQVSATFSAGVS